MVGTKGMMFWPACNPALLYRLMRNVVPHILLLLIFRLLEQTVCHPSAPVRNRPSLPVKIPAEVQQPLCVLPGQTVNKAAGKQAVLHPSCSKLCSGRLGWEHEKAKTSAVVNGH